MKLQKISLFALILAALFFCVSCGGGSDKPDLDEDIVDNDSDNPEEQDSSDTDSGNDTSDTTDDSSDTADDNGDTGPDGDNSRPENPDEGDSGRPDGDNSIPEDPDEGDSGRPDGESVNDNDPGDDDDPEEDEDYDPFPGKDEPAVLCTGLTKCYSLSGEIDCPEDKSDDFFGQDTQYAKRGYCLKKSYSTTDSSKTVTDRITNLVWEKNVSSTFAGCNGNNGATCSYEEAENYCSNLKLENRTWRLPTLKELETLIDFAQIPTITQNYFTIPSTGVKKFWTSTPSKANPGRYWILDFGTALISDEKPGKYFYPKCVSGDPLPAPEFEEVSGNSDQKIVKDEVSNLEWTVSDNNLRTWLAALSYCKKLKYAGRRGWRLPSINELATIVNYSNLSPASDFPGISSAYFWSSSTNPASDTQAWRIHTYSGVMDYGKKSSETYKVICVQ